jgi:hypothetical protein
MLRRTPHRKARSSGRMAEIFPRGNGFTRGSYRSADGSSKPKKSPARTKPSRAGRHEKTSKGTKKAVLVTNSKFRQRRKWPPVPTPEDVIDLTSEGDDKPETTFVDLTPDLGNVAEAPSKGGEVAIISVFNPESTQSRINDFTKLVIKTRKSSTRLSDYILSRFSSLQEYEGKLSHFTKSH